VSRGPQRRVLGVDVGTVRVGLATSDETHTIATPLEALPRQRDLWPRLLAEISQRSIDMVVVGLPRRLDGGEGEAAEDARAFAAELERRAHVAVSLWDERYTTALAERHLVSAGVRRRQRRDSVDAVAAALMLQSWLDAQRAGA
jgi:putative holliday junction resolvase